MRVLFVYPYLSRYIHAPFDYGISSLSAILKADGHITRLLSFTSIDTASFENCITEFSPQLICVSVWSGKVREVVEFVEWASRYHIPIIVGGIYPTVAPEKAIAQFKPACGICVGEGDLALREFVRALEEGKDCSLIKNIWVRHNESIIRNPLAPLVDDLDILPLPDREIFNLQKSIADTGTVKFNASRGCPNSCSFCAESYLKQIYPERHKLRRRSVRRLLEEICSTIQSYRSVQYIGFDDDCFTIGKSWIREFCRAYASEIGIPFYVNTRVDLMDDEIAQWLKEANCVEIRMGIESGNEALRNIVLQKNVTNAQIIRAFKIVKDHEIHSLAYNMIGVPFETEATLRETFELNRLIAPKYVRVSVFQPYLGTHLYHICKVNDWIKEEDVETSYYGPYLLQQPSIQSEKIEFYYKLFMQEFQTKVHLEINPEKNLIL